MAGKESDLGLSVFDIVEDGLERRFTETAFFSGFHIFLESRTETFWSKIKSIPKWFVNAVECITTGHEDLALC